MNIDEWIPRSSARDRFPLYTRANVGEVFPDPVVPLTFDWLIVETDKGWRDAWVRIGAFTPDEFNPDDIETIGIFGGYCYLNASMIRLFGERAPGLSAQAMDEQFFGNQPGIEPYRPHPDDERPELSAKIGETFAWVLTTTELDQVREHEALVRRLRAERPDLSSLSELELWERADQLGRAHQRALFGEHIFITYMATVPLGIISAVCEALGRPSDTLKLVAGVGDVESAAPSMAMWELGRQVAGSAELTALFDEGISGLADRISASDHPEVVSFAEAIDGFLERFGARGPNEWEARCPTWETEPELALAAIDRMRLSPPEASPSVHQADRAAERERLSAELLSLVEGDPETHGQLAAALAAAPRFMAGRERTKTNNITMINELRVMLWELGDRLVAAGLFDDRTDFAFLLVDELRQVITDRVDLRERIRERRADFEDLAGRQEPFILSGEPPVPSSWPRRGAEAMPVLGVGDELMGLPGCPGQARGRARVVLDSHDPSALAPGDVLVAPLTDPSWTPLFVPAAAVVVDVGAPLSHAVIVSRELGIPCVVSATGATRSIPDGALVEVDGDTGLIRVLED